MIGQHRLASKCLALGVFFATWPASAQPGGGKPKAQVDLLSSVETVVPGAAFDVAVRFRLTSGWHVYWQNPGDAGIAPGVVWTLPAGFTAGEFQFPVPTRHRDHGDLITNVLEGEPVLVARITPGGTIEAGPVNISAKVTYLVCKELCLREVAEVRVALPASLSGSEAKAANEEVFARARKALPIKSSTYLTVAPSVTASTLEPGRPFELLLTIDIKPGFHIQSHEPLNPALIPCEVFLERTDGVILKIPAFPSPQVRTDPKLGQMSEYTGKLVIRAAGEVEGEASAGAFRLGGLFRFQACDDRGTCFPPEALAFSIPTIIGGAPSGGGSGGGAPTLSEPTTATPAGSTSTGAPGGGTGSVSGAAAPDVPTTLFGWLLFAFLGGLILNVMPCVLPVISIKILSFVQQSRDDPRRVFRLGMTFVAGVVSSFLALALLIIVLKGRDQAAGWGFQFQSPVFVIVMCAIIFVFGLSLFGVFLISLPGAAMTKLSVAESHEGYVGAFMKGILGTVLATPCTAPFLGAALGFAWASSNSMLLATFTSVGLGMASPFIVLSLRPRWLRFLPKPGLWMEHFKQLMGFVLMGTVVWLLISIGDLIGARGVAWTVAFLCFLAVAVWILGRQTVLTPLPIRLTAWGAAVLVAMGGGWFCYGHNFDIDEGKARMARVATALREYELKETALADGANLRTLDFTDHIPWQTWVKGRAEDLALAGHTVYVDYTATWCLTCQTNKKVTLESEAVRRKMDELDVVPLKADFTSFDADIFADLQRFARAGVPLNLIYPAGQPDGPIVLPEVLLPGLVLAKLDEAASRQPRPSSNTAAR